MLSKSGRKKWYIWVISCPFAVYYQLNPSRGGHVAENLLGNYEGTVITDEYTGYNGLSRAGPNAKKSLIVRANCWAHARRKLIECENYYSVECNESIE